MDMDAGYFSAGLTEDLNINAAAARADTRPMPPKEKRGTHVRGMTNLPRDRKLAYTTVGECSIMSY
jgi:hypothetical protein